MTKTVTEPELEALPYSLGVHITHCCAQHGCKYGDQDCCVEKNEYQQRYACEECSSVESIERKIASLLTEKAWTEKLLAAGISVPDFGEDFDY